MTLNVVQQEDLQIFKAEILGTLARIEKKLTERDDKRDWLTENQAMEILDVSKSTIRNYRLNGMLPFSQIKNKIYIRRTDVNDFITKNYINNAEFQQNI